MPTVHSVLPDFRSGHFTTPDGVSLGYQSVGQGAPIVLANGLGGTFHTWRHLLSRFGTEYQIVSWDYRGLHSSPPPKNRTAIHMPHHIDDLEAVLDFFDIQKAVFVGWSMGAQVNFEFYRRRPEAFAGLCIFNGTAGSPFTTAIGGRFTHRIIPSVLKEIKKTAAGLSAIARIGSHWSGTIEVFKQLGIVANSIDEDVFTELLADFGALDFALYMDLLRALGQHDAWDILPKINCPTAIICGDNDILTPVKAAKRMHNEIHEATLEIISNCTHYGAVEHPHRYNQGLETLLHRAKW